MYLSSRMKNNCYSSLLFILFIFATLGCNGQTAPIDTPQHQELKQILDSAHQAEQQGNAEAAMHYHKRVLQRSRDFGMPEQEARALVKIAMLLKNKDAGASLQHLKSALEISERIGHHELKTDILLAMTEVFKQQENYKEALLALEAHQKLLQATLAKNKAHEIARIRSAEAAKLERYVFISIIVIVLLIATAMAMYFTRTNKLNKELRASNLIKDKLFSIIGHDLRGPAGGIMEALDMIDSGILNEAEQKEILSLLKKQSRSFNETLNSLLSWASTQLQGAETRKASFQLKTIIQKSLDVLEGQARQKKLAIRDHIPDKLFVLADMNQVDFVIRNLLSNAIKFSFENSTIEVDASEKDDQIVISVSDHGVGIPPAKQKLFAATSNYMESSFGTKGEPGTGLGLMLSKEFLLANNGRMWLESTEGKGTTVFVALQNSPHAQPA